MTESIVTENAATDERAQMIRGLHDLAEFLAAQPAITPCSQTYNVYVTDRDELTRIARLGSWRKVYNGPYFSLVKDFSGGVRLEVFTDRSTVCRKVVTGQRTIPAQPATDERVEDIVEWQCDDAVLLGGAQ